MAFIKKNLNPVNNKVADADIRAVAAACNISWEQAFLGLNEIALSMKSVSYDVKVVEQFMKENGFLVGQVKVPKGSKRPTVREFSENNPELVAVVRISGGYTACAYGNYVDTWDTGDSAIYKYFYKHIQNI